MAGSFSGPTPKADFCWEGRLGLSILLLCILYIFTLLRVKALRGITYSALSPRGISGACMIGVTVICTAYTCVVIWNYSVWYNIRGIYEQAAAEQNDELIGVLKGLVPAYRKKVSFVLRMLLVTVLWLVKVSFVVIYYEFSAQLPRKTRVLLNFTAGMLGATYAAVWIATVANFRRAMEREGYSPASGAGVTLFTPVNTWAEYEDFEYSGDRAMGSLLGTELTITSLNVFTDLLLLLLIFLIFRHLNLARGRTQFRAARLLTALAATTIVIALVRLSILSTQLHYISVRLAFDTLTDIEAFVAGCAGCIPAMRVLMREAGGVLGASVFGFGFAESWGTIRGGGGGGGGGKRLRSKTTTTIGTGTGRSGVQTRSGEWTYISNAAGEGGGTVRGDGRGAGRGSTMQWHDIRVQGTDSANASTLSPVGKVVPKRGWEGETKEQFEEVSWTELAERGIR